MVSIYKICNTGKGYRPATSSVDIEKKGEYMDYFYQIKICHPESAYGMRELITQNIISAENKKEVLSFISTEYPEYFEGNKVVQKLSKKSEQIVYVTIYELDDYWKNYWLQNVECMVCGKKVPLIHAKNHLGSINIKKFTCSIKCEEKRKEGAESETEEYWNDRCLYYFIYKITNKLNGKLYIGYTEREPIFRWWEHFKHSNLPIGEALKTDGIENFTFEVLEKHSKEEKSVKEMHEIETKYIALYDSIKSGYNCIVSKIS